MAHLWMFCILDSCCLPHRLFCRIQCQSHCASNLVHFPMGLFAQEPCVVDVWRCRLYRWLLFGVRPAPGRHHNFSFPPLLETAAPPFSDVIDGSLDDSHSSLFTVCGHDSRFWQTDNIGDSLLSQVLPRTVLPATPSMEVLYLFTTPTFQHRLCLLMIPVPHLFR